MSSNIEDESAKAGVVEPFIEGVDYYSEDGLMVLTRNHLLRRGFCCKNGCRNCPYGFVPDVSQ